MKFLATGKKVFIQEAHFLCMNKIILSLQKKIKNFSWGETTLQLLSSNSAAFTIPYGMQDPPYHILMIIRFAPVVCLLNYICTFIGLSFEVAFFLCLSLVDLYCSGTAIP